MPHFSLVLFYRFLLYCSGEKIIWHETRDSEENMRCSFYMKTTTAKWIQSICAYFVLEDDIYKSNAVFEMLQLAEFRRDGSSLFYSMMGKMRF